MYTVYLEMRRFAILDIPLEEYGFPKLDYNKGRIMYQIPLAQFKYKGPAMDKLYEMARCWKRLQLEEETDFMDIPLIFMGTYKAPRYYRYMPMAGINIVCSIDYGGTNRIKLFAADSESEVVHYE